MRTLLFIALGGSLGAVSRYLLSGWVQGWLKESTFPWGTLAVNVAGCFLIGVLSYLGNERNLLTPEARLLLAIGFLGALTTFSTFGSETMLLVRAGQMGSALLNIAASNLCGLLAVWLGFTLAGMLWR